MITLIDKYKKILLLLIVLFAFLLRFANVANNPPSLNWDEASIGYNAYSILQTGKDEYGNFLPSSIRSFDDYKPPVYAYLTVPSIAVFGLSEFAVRFPAVIFGALSVLILYFLTREILVGLTKPVRESVSLLSAFFLCVSPWHLQFSRAAYEGNIGLFFLMTAFYLFLVSARRKYFLIFSSVLFVLSVYSYHSFRLVVPLFMVSLIAIFYKELLNKKTLVIISGVIFSILVLPVYLSFVNPEGSKARLSMVSIFAESGALQNNLNNLQIARQNNDFIGEVINNRRVFFAREMAKGYFDHFTPNFLFVTGANSNHHHAYNFGMMYLWDLPFLLLGIYFLLRGFDKYILSLFLFLLIAPMPAAITTGTPHGVRAIAMVLPLIFFVGAGFFSFLEVLPKVKNKLLRNAILGGVFILFLFNFVIYLHQYHIETPRIYGYFWSVGSNEAIIEAKQIDASYEKIIMIYN